MLRVAAFDLGQGKDQYCTVYGPVPNRLPVISMSTRFHDKTVETADNPIYNVLFFIRPFEKRSYYVIPLGVRPSVRPSVNFFVSV